MAEVIVKKDKKKINDGGHKPFGVDLDPNNELCHMTSPDKDADVYCKGDKITYTDYISELRTRYNRKLKGKDPSSIGVFGGVNFDKNGKIIKPLMREGKQ